jgi:hypothetical protein
VARETQVHLPARPVFWAGVEADAVFIKVDAGACAWDASGIAMNAAKAALIERNFPIAVIAKAPCREFNARPESEFRQS